MAEDKKDKENKKFGEDALEAINSIFEEDELEEHDEEAELEEAKSRMTYHGDKRSLNMARRKVTDCKGNSRVIFPKKMCDLDFESRLDMFRLEAMGIFQEYVKKNCNDNGKQQSNLNKSQSRGLKSLRKRIKEGEIVITPTDKTGNLAVFSRESFEEAGSCPYQE